MRHSRTSNARGLSKPVVYGSARYRRNAGLAQSNGSSGSGEQIISGVSNTTLYIGGGAVVGGLLLWTLFSGGSSGKADLPTRA